MMQPFFIQNCMKVFTFIFLFSSLSSLYSQNTVGTILFDTDRSLTSYNLFYPGHQSSVFLINNCGQIVNEWTDEEDTRPGISAKLTQAGDLIKAKINANIPNYFGAGGSGGVLESRNWENELLWSHTDSDSLSRQHHDFEIMPNGNVLYISWNRIGLDDLIVLGYDTLENSMKKLWFDCIREYSPSMDSIVWEWCSYNHTVQELFAEYENFGDVADNPDRININYQKFSFGREDWMHSNAVAYNEELDQIALSVRNFNEIWIIDHSTTTLEASQDSGGLRNKGGRILHRWGNPEAYNSGDSLSRKLFFPHNVKWIRDSSSIYNNEILVYNNLINPDLSLGAMYATPIDSNGLYLMEEGKFLPLDFTRTISHPDTIRNLSGAGSNVELLPNGNFFMQSTKQGRGFELTDDEEVVWEYVIPMIFGEPVPQGTVLGAADNFNFSMLKYAVDFPGFEGKDLSPGAYIEIEPNLEFCLLDDVDNLSSQLVKLFPNPAYDHIHVTLEEPISELKIYNLNGNCVRRISSVSLQNKIDISDLTGGMYFIQINNKMLKFVVR